MAQIIRVASEMRSQSCFGGNETSTSSVPQEFSDLSYSYTGCGVLLTCDQQGVWGLLTCATDDEVDAIRRKSPPDDDPVMAIPEAKPIRIMCKCHKVTKLKFQRVLRTLTATHTMDSCNYFWRFKHWLFLIFITMSKIYTVYHILLFDKVIIDLENPNAKMIQNVNERFQAKKTCSISL